MQELSEIVCISNSRDALVSDFISKAGPVDVA